MKFYFGTPGWGWRMFGIGWKTKWFLGLSIRAKSNEGQIELQPGELGHEGGLLTRDVDSDELYEIACSWKEGRGASWSDIVGHVSTCIDDEVEAQRATWKRSQIERDKNQVRSK